LIGIGVVGHNPVLWTILRMNTAPHDHNFRWDIFCRVIDNFGDVGVCWRLAVNLAQRGQTVRLWVDDTAALAWMAPGGAPGVQVHRWTSPFSAEGITPGEVMIEAFGCEVAPEFVASYAYYIRTTGRKCRWINLEYLTAESYAMRCHSLPSPVMDGPGRGLVKHFYYPGFAPGTGGLLRETNLTARQAAFDRADWLARQHIGWCGERLVSLFCYEPPRLGQLLEALAADARPTLMLVAAGRSATALHEAVDALNKLKPLWNNHFTLSFSFLPTLAQVDFDHLLWSCDLNFVRGEDSLVRAIWAGRPMIWQIYPQSDDAHQGKLQAFLDWLQAPASLRQFHLAWNNFEANLHAIADDTLPPLTDINRWHQTLRQARQTLLQQDDLASALLRFTAKTN
jgi:uncharacterized repeat protein (TIGR03837 family)